MDRCLNQERTISECSNYYTPGYDLDYPMNSSNSSIDTNSATLMELPKLTSPDKNKSIKSNSHLTQKSQSIVHPNVIADRCRVAFSGINGAVSIEGHADRNRQCNKFYKK